MNQLFVFSFLLAIASSYAAVVPAASYVVSIQGKDGGAPICGGVLINEKTVLTTAQCLASYDIEQFVVSVNNGSQIIKIAAHTFDAAFDFVTMENNIGILKLAKSAKANVIKLAQEQPKTGTSGVIYSWSTNGILNRVDVELISTSDCASGDYGWSQDEVLKTMVCGSVKNSNTCVGRFGSPVVSDNKLVGLTSWGGCGTNGQAAVFTDVPSLRSWIKSSL